MLLRAAGAAVLALAVAWLITAATDEGGISWEERAGRTLPLTPACAAVGAWAALASARARGEVLALSALGRSQVQVAAPAVVGGALVAILAATAMAVAVAVDVAPFFPRAVLASAWVWTGDSFVNRAQGLRVGPDGAPVQFARDAATVEAEIPPQGRAAAALAISVAGVALPLVLAHALLSRPPAGTPGRGARDRRRSRETTTAALATAGAVAASLAVFQAAAARRVPALLGVAPPLALLVFAVQRYRSSP